MEPNVVAPEVNVTETPEFKEALKEAVKAEREQLEKTIRESNQTHLDEERRKLESVYGKPVQKTTPDANGKDFFVQWGEKHALPPEAGLELAQGIVDYVRKVDLAPLTQSQRRSELRMQRQDVRDSAVRKGKPGLVALDDKYHDEVMKLLESVASIHADSYAAALELVIGRHFDDELVADRKSRKESDSRETEVIKPGPTPTASTPKVKTKETLSAYQQQRAVEMGLSDEDYAERMKSRARGMKSRGFSEESIRQQMGRDLGTLTV